MNTLFASLIAFRVRVIKSFLKSCCASASDRMNATGMYSTRLQRGLATGLCSRFAAWKISTGVMSAMTSSRSATCTLSFWISEHLSIKAPQTILCVMMLKLSQMQVSRSIQLRLTQSTLAFNHAGLSLSKGSTQQEKRPSSRSLFMAFLPLRKLSRKRNKGNFRVMLPELILSRR